MTQVDPTEIIKIGDDEFYRFDPDRHVAYAPDGRRLTSEVLDELADRAERTGPPPWLKPGGKSLSGDGSHSPRIQVVLPRAVKAEVDARAKAAHMSTSKWVRRTIEQALAA